MGRLTDTALRAALKKPHAAQVELADSAVPGLTVRVGGGSAATWSLILRVTGEGGVCQPASKTDHLPAPNIDQGSGLFG
jgi:hypothetical protein